MVWYSHLLKNFPQFVVIHTVKMFSIVNEAEIDVFLESPCVLYDPTDVGNCLSILHIVVTSLSLFTFMHWRRKWQPTPVFLPGEFQGICNRWGHKELDTTKQLSLSHANKITLKILQARLQQYMNHELPDVQAGFRKGRRTRDQIANI